MTEVIASVVNRRKPGVRPLKKARLFIDMTPMVDLGFLLICFFVFTTEISKPVVTHLYMPNDKGDSTLVAASKSLSLFLDNSSQILYYFGDLDKALQDRKIFHTAYSEFDGIGEVIRKKQNELKSRHLDSHELIVSIKAGEDCPYNHVLHILDEMLINDVTRFALVDAEKNEENRLKMAF